jgi:superfamily II DNA or RNA helicase
LSSIPPTGALWPRILSEDLVPVTELLAVALEPAGEASPRAVAGAAARALLDECPVAPFPWPSWLAPHQIPAANRLTAIIARHGGALLADEVGLGKSYIALAVALARKEPFVLVVPAVLVPQWRALLGRFDVHDARIITHESLSLPTTRPSQLLLDRPSAAFVIIDEAHRFRNPETNRYRALARLLVGSQVLLVTATPIHNRLADLLHLLRLFLRDHALAALGVPSLRAAAQHDAENSLASAAAARLIVARSRERVQSGYNGGPVTLTFPRASAEQMRAGTTTDAILVDLVQGISRLRAGGTAAPLLRLMLLRRLGSSIPAFRAGLARYDAFLDLASRAAAENRALTSREFQRCFPRAAESDIQLVLFPLLLQQPAGAPAGQPVALDREILARLRAIVSRIPADDPKADALAQLLETRPGKTIVFTDAQPTVRYLMHRLRQRRVAAVFGRTGRFGAGNASRREVLEAFAPQAQGAAVPVPALETDLLIATDLLSEGLNLQDAERVVHYDLPWSPARLAQRVGRIDRLGSPHRAISTITFLPPPQLADALAIEERLAAKVSAQHVAGANGRLDWCDQLAALIMYDPAARGSCAAVTGTQESVVLVVRIANLVDAIVVADGVARTNPAAATRCLTDAMNMPAASLDRIALGQAIEAAAPLIKARLAAVQDARWRAGDRDRFARRLIPWVLSVARRAARRGDGEQLRALDTLVSRLALGMTAGEELLLDDVLSQHEPLSVSDLLAWHMRLPPPEAEEATAGVELVAAVTVALA